MRSRSSRTGRSRGRRSSTSSPASEEFRARARARRRRRPRARSESATRADPLAPGSAGHGRARRGDPVGPLAPSNRRVACSRSATRSPSPPISEGFSVRASTSSGSISRRVTSRGWRPSSRTFASSRSRTSRSTRSSSSRRSSTSAPTTPCTGSRPSRRRVEARGTPRARPRASGEAEASSSRCRSASPVITAGSGRRTSRLDDASSPSAGFFVEEIEAYELDRRGLACGTGLRVRRRALRRTRAGRVGRSVRRSLARAAPPAADPSGLATTAKRRASTTSASRARERLELPRWTSS